MLVLCIHVCLCVCAFWACLKTRATCHTKHMHKVILLPSDDQNIILT